MNTIEILQVKSSNDSNQNIDATLTTPKMLSASKNNANIVLVCSKLTKKLKTDGVNRTLHKNRIDTKVCE